MLKMGTSKIKAIRRIRGDEVVNLTCSPHPMYFSNGMLSHNCDTPYAFRASRTMSVDELVELGRQHKTRHVVITGGEPMAYPATASLIYSLLAVGCSVEVETSGVYPIPERLKNIEPIRWNVSPKLATMHPKMNYTVESLSGYIANKHTIFKFVISDVEKDVAEIDAILSNFPLHYREQIWLMPEGVSKEAQEANMPGVIQLAMERGWNFSPRLHILVWNMKRGV